MDQTTKRRLIELSLVAAHENDLETLVADWRRKGVSWPVIASRIEQLTEVEISRMTLADWFPEYNRPAEELAEVRP